MFSKDRTQELIIVSVGGSLVVPNGGIDTDFLNQFNGFIRKHVKKGRRFFIVVGGGSIARRYRDAGKKIIGEITDEDLDWLGVHATRLNGHLLRTIFQDIAHPRIIENYDKKLQNWKESVAIGAGWKPGWSTDYDCVVLARDYGSNIIVNLSDIDSIYDRDPAKFKNAKPIDKTTWDYYQTLVGETWVPGSNLPFDPIASKLAKDLGLTVIIVNGKNFNNLDNLLNGESFKGTVITPLKIDAAFYDRDYFEGKKGEHRFPYTESIIGRFFHYLINLYRALWIRIVFNPKNCLDVGCGTGKLVKALRQIGIEAQGVEISHYALEAADRDIKPYLKYGDIVHLPHPESSFDLVLTYDVLEHIERSKLRSSVEETIRVSSKWIVHKVYTSENRWLKVFHAKDPSHLSVLNKNYWLNMFKYIENITIIRSFFKLPQFFETIFVLKKK